MLSKKENEFLNRKYPLIKPQSILILAPAIAVVLVLALIFLYGQTDLLTYGFAVLGGAVVFATSLTAFFIHMFNREAVRRSCVAVTHGLAFRLNKNEFDQYVYGSVLNFAKEAVVYDIVGMAAKALSSFAAIPAKHNIPMIFVTIRPIGKMFVEGRFKRAERIKGVKPFQWREIEWVGYRARARRMVLHETGHAILSSSNAKYDEEKQHNLINASGVEFVLEVVKKDV